MIKILRFRPNTPVLFLVAWSLSELGGLVNEKNRYEAMCDKYEKDIGFLQTIRSRVRAGEKVNVQTELQKLQKPGFDDMMEEIEKFDKEWSDEVSQLSDNPQKDKKRNEVNNGRFV